MCQLAEIRPLLNVCDSVVNVAIRRQFLYSIQEIAFSVATKSVCKSASSASIEVIVLHHRISVSSGDPRCLIGLLHASALIQQSPSECLSETLIEFRQALTEI